MEMIAEALGFAYRHAPLRQYKHFKCTDGGVINGYFN